MRLTCHHSQSQLVFVIIEPARYFHTASIHPGVALLHLPDGERHIAITNITLEQVPLRQSAGHRGPVCLDHLIVTATVRDGSSTPACRKLAVVLGIIVAYQSYIFPHRGYDALCRYTTWEGRMEPYIK